MQRPALGGVPGSSSDILVIKATATGITFLHDRKFRQRYNGSKTSAVGINGEIWPRRSDYEKMQRLKIPSRLISHSLNGLHYLNKEKYIQATTPKGKKKAGTAACSMLVTDPGGPLKPDVISPENLINENFSPDSGKKLAKKERKKSYSVNKREVRQRILAYINTAKGQKELYFWTVTFPEGTPDDVCYQAFNTWLTTLRTRQKDKFGKLMPAMLREYIWVAERQTGERLTTNKAPTNTIHFHIAIPHYMSVWRANAAMKTILRNLAKAGALPGAVCCPRTGSRYYLPCIARYNGVHISRTKQGKIINFAVRRSGRMLASYLTKYVTKNDAGIADKDGNVAVPGFNHLAWHNSRGFSVLFTGVAFSVAEFTKFGFGFFLNRVRKFRMEFATFVPWLFGPPPLLLDHLFQLNSYMQTLFNDTQTIHPG